MSCQSATIRYCLKLVIAGVDHRDGLCGRRGGLVGDEASGQRCNPNGPAFDHVVVQDPMGKLLDLAFGQRWRDFDDKAPTKRCCAQGVADLGGRSNELGAVSVGDAGTKAGLDDERIVVSELGDRFGPSGDRVDEQRARHFIAGSLVDVAAQMCNAVLGDGLDRNAKSRCRTEERIVGARAAMARAYR